MKKILFFTVALLMGMNSWAAERNLNLENGWEGASFNPATKTITFPQKWGAWGDVGGGSWPGTDLTGWKEVVVEFDGPTTIPIELLVQYREPYPSPPIEVVSPVFPVGSTEGRLALGGAGNTTELAYVMISLGSETQFGSVKINRFYLTDEATLVTPTLGNGDLTFESDVIGNGYEAPVPWAATGAYALIAANPAPDAINSSSKVLKLDVLDEPSDGYSQVVKFPNTSLAAGKTWKDVEAVEFKVLAPINGYNIHFGAGLPGTGFAGINYGGDGNTLPNFWVQGGYPNYSDGSGWTKFSIDYDPNVNLTTTEVLNSGAVDFYLGINTIDATIYFDDITFVYKPDAPVAPTISGPTQLSLIVGYAATSTGVYTIGGTEPVSVSITSSDAGQITWNSSTKRLDIAQGIAPGVYQVVLKATNGTAPDATWTFTLTVNESAIAPTLNGPTALTLENGYAATSTGAYTIGGTEPVDVSITSSDAGQITWNNDTKKLDIATGIVPGVYQVVLKATNGTAPDATLTFTLTVNEPAVAPTISGLPAMTLPDGYESAYTGAYTITGTEPVSVSMTGNNADGKITWNSAEKRIEIAGGIQPGTYVVVLTATNGTAPDATLTFTLTVEEGNGCSEIQASRLKAWISNGQLYVKGLIVGETLSVYGVNGAIIYKGVATSGEVNISLPAQGVYIVGSGSNTIKVAF